MMRIDADLKSTWLPVKMASEHFLEVGADGCCIHVLCSDELVRLSVRIN